MGVGCVVPLTRNLPARDVREVRVNFLPSYPAPPTPESNPGQPLRLKYWVTLPCACNYRVSLCSGRGSWVCQGVRVRPCLSADYGLLISKRDLFFASTSSGGEERRCCSGQVCVCEFEGWSWKRWCSNFLWVLHLVDLTHLSIVCSHLRRVTCPVWRCRWCALSPPPPHRPGARSGSTITTNHHN